MEIVDTSQIFHTDTPSNSNTVKEQSVSLNVSHAFVFLSVFQEYMPLPPEEAENGENAGNEEPKLQFSYVECLLYSFHQLGRKLPDFLTAKLNAEKLKDFKIR